MKMLLLVIAFSLAVPLYLFFDTYFKRKSDKNKYPCACLKSSNRVEDTSLESFKKQNNVTNISTNSKGASSGTFFIFSMHNATQDLAKNNNTSIYVEPIKTNKLQWMYPTTGGVKPCRDNVIKTSAALFLHIILYTGHHEVIAENSNDKSSFRANSSAGILWLHNLTSNCNTKRIHRLHYTIRLKKIKCKQVHVVC